jgi:exonuclease III
MVDLPAGIEAVRTAVTVLTWNVWFDEFEYTLRCNSIFSVCKELNPDVICFQEVLPQFVDLLQSEKWTRSYRLSTDFLESSVSPYGVMILAKASLQPSFSIHVLNSVMDRKFVAADLKVNNWHLFVGTVHLESLKFSDLRRDQLGTISNILREHDNSIFCGDFNFCSYRNFIEGGELENNALQEILPDHIDMWSAFHDTDESKGYTYDSENNPMITHEERMRYDRIMYNFAKPESGLDCTYWPQWIRLVGTEPIRQLNGKRVPSRGSSSANKSPASPLRAIAEDIAAVLPSDHFGLFAGFELHRYGAEQKKDKDCAIC